MHSNDTTIPLGYCQCGCGERTNTAPTNITRKGLRKGDPYKFIAGHQRRLSPVQYIIDESTGCWLWQRALDINGYGVLRVDGKNHRAHRYMFEMEHGPIPEGHDLDHLCRVPACVNPDHLEPVLPAVNVRRGSRTILSEEDAALIRSLYPQLSHGKLARQFGVSVRNIRSILNNLTWRQPTPRRLAGPKTDNH